MVEAVINREFDLPIESKQLTNNPIPINHEPHYRIEEPGILQQTDIISFPNYEGFNVMMLVIDINNRLCDGRPIKAPPKGRISDLELWTALSDIYNPGEYVYQGESDYGSYDFTDFYRKNENGEIIPWLQTPKILQGDGHFSGEEFVNLCKDAGINVKITVPHRSNQNAYIEGINSWFRRRVNQYLLGRTVENGKTEKNWLYCVMKLIQLRNQFIIDGLKGTETKHYRIPGHIVMNHRTPYLLANNTRIRIHLDTPHDFKTGKHVNSDRTHTKIVNRFSDNVYRIVESVLIPGNPPLYYVRREGRDAKTGKKYKKLNALYPAEQLLVLPPD